jgi:hypothetical protein
LLKASQNADNISTFIIDELKDEGCIREIGDELSYTITGIGIWEIEKNFNLSENQLIHFIDDKFFVAETQNKELNDKEKIVLFSFIAIRAFSNESCINLKKSEKMKESMKRIIDASHKTLLDLDIITMDYSRLYGKKGNEHIVSNLIRHTDKLPKKTKSIFFAPGDQKYYLNLSNNGKIDRQEFLWLLRKIITREKLVDLSQLDKLINFLNSISFSEGYLIYDNIDKTFINHETDTLIEESLKDLIFNF